MGIRNILDFLKKIEIYKTKLFIDFFEKVGNISTVCLAGPPSLNRANAHDHLFVPFRQGLISE